MCIFCVSILPNCPLFVCVLNLTFQILRQVSSRKKNASSNLKRSLHLGTKIKSNGCLINRSVLVNDTTYFTIEINTINHFLNNRVKLKCDIYYEMEEVFKLLGTFFKTYR